ncbi:MAG: hypothetical protein IJ617_09005 [Oscillospiraceae bacterium]|nr:hypothetical protein [Oscillospiraceae bacterium]
MKNLFIGNEQLQVGGRGISVTVNNFWRWAGSDLNDTATRSVFAEFLVASSLEILADGRATDRSYDLLWPQGDGAGIRANVRTAAYIQTDDAEHPDQIFFDLGFRDRCDVFVFCVFKSMTPEQSPLDTELWDFYALRSGEWDGIGEERRSATVPAILRLGPVWSDYYGIGEAIQKTMAAR